MMSALQIDFALSMELHAQLALNSIVVPGVVLPVTTTLLPAYLRGRSKGDSFILLPRCLLRNLVSSYLSLVLKNFNIN